MLLGFLQQHTQAVHGGGGGQQASSTSKLEKLPRPTFTLNMSESQWNFTKIQWDNYIKQSVVSDSVKLTQLQAACDNTLRQRVFDEILSGPSNYIAPSSPRTRHSARVAENQAQRKSFDYSTVLCG